MATKANLVIDQGTNFSTTISIANMDDEAIDLTGYSAVAQIRKHHSSSNSVSFGVSIDAALGDLTLSLTPTQTNAMVPGRYVYDVEVTDSSNVVSRIVEGLVTITPSVTR